MAMYRVVNMYTCRFSLEASFLCVLAYNIIHMRVQIAQMLFSFVVP